MTVECVSHGTDAVEFAAGSMESKLSWASAWSSVQAGHVAVVHHPVPLGQKPWPSQGMTQGPSNSAAASSCDNLWHALLISLAIVSCKKYHPAL